MKGTQAKKSARKRAPLGITRGIAHIKATFNNTIVSITTEKGDCLCWASGGTVGFKGARKGTAFAARMVAESTARKALSLGIREIEVRVKGPGSGREPAITALQKTGLNIVVIKDVTPIPHNGCRPRKRRRV